ALPYGTWDQIIPVPNNFIGYENFTLSAHVAPFELTTFNVQVSVRLQALTSSGSWIADLASNKFTLDHTKKHEWMRVSVTSSNGLPPNTESIRVRLFLDDTTSASAMCLCDGVQLVPFNYPVPYYPESQVYRVMTGDDRIPNLQVNTLVADGNAVFLGDSTVISNANISNIAHLAHSLLSLRNGWSNYGGSFQRPRFTKNADGMVYLSGMVTGGSFPSTIATLPVGSRPENTEIFGVDSGGSYGQVRVYNDGRIVAQSGSASWVSLSGVVFRAASV
ncbi:hypothetical protein, partial [Gracilibacillus dipsosauri]|uniref:hypothetical protein n=1 Tax=Gracilibacillus dipsosauri TaxID=178340 RepID=UPI003D3510EF